MWLPNTKNWSVCTHASAKLCTKDLQIMKSKCLVYINIMWSILVIISRECGNDHLVISNQIIPYVIIRASNGSPSQLFGTLMILKASCMHNPCYIDRLITSFMRVLQRMAREHLTPSTPESSPGIERIIISFFS